MKIVNSLIRIVAVAATLSSGLSHAGSYSEAADIEARCSFTGQLTATTYRGRVAGISKETAIDMAIRQYGDNPTPMQKAPVVIAYDMAIDERDAYRRGWAYCMDQHNPSKPKSKK